MDQQWHHIKVYAAESPRVSYAVCLRSNCVMCLLKNQFTKPEDLTFTKETKMVNFTFSSSPTFYLNNQKMCSQSYRKNMLTAYGSPTNNVRHVKRHLLKNTYEGLQRLLGRLPPRIPVSTPMDHSLQRCMRNKVK